MTEACPVCGEAFEYRQVEERDREGDGAGASIEVDDLCAADPDVRWNRICPRATTTAGEDGDPRVRLEVYRHHWESTS